MSLKWTSEPFTKRPWGVRLEDTISDAMYHLRIGHLGEGNYQMPKPAALRYEEAQIGTGPFKNVYCDDKCWFRWGVNRSGATISQFQVARKAANQAVTADVAGTVSTFTDTAQFTEHEEVGNILYILDDAGAAGAAPEGEWGVIVKNDANTLTVQGPRGANAAAFSAATAVGDTGIIYSVGKLDLLASALEREETFGVALVDFEDNYWGWFLCKGIVSVYVKAATAIAQGNGLIGDTAGRLTISSTSGQDIMLARSIVNCSGDIASDVIPVFFDVIHGTPFTSA